MSGKGSSPRPFSVSHETFSNNWNKIFGGNEMQVRTKESKEEFGSCGCGRSPTGKCVGWHSLTEDQYQDRKEKYETGKIDLSGKEIK